MDLCGKERETCTRYLKENFEDVWEFPGKWYYYVSVPQGAGGRESLIRTIVHDTKEYYRTGTKPPEYCSMGINR